MKTYPSITSKIEHGQYVYIFDKLDGSNIRVEWSKKKGFHKFGTRKRLLDKDEPILGEAHTLFFEQFEQKLLEIFKKQKWTQVTLFFEFFGNDSFAGRHRVYDDYKLVLIDVNIYKKGIMAPGDFIRLFSGVVDIPKYLGYRIMSPKIEQDIRLGQYDGVTDEGVVCKYVENKHHYMFKIKTNKWLDRLKTFCDGNTSLFKELL